MSLTLLGWLLIVSSIVISALAIFPQRSRDSRRETFDLDAWRARVADAPGPGLLSRLRQSSRVFGRDLQGTAWTVIAAAAVFVLVAGIGAATSYVRHPPEATGSEDTDAEILAHLEDYTRSIASAEPASAAAAGQLLPDVSTMIERLAARLESAPEDIDGWRMLGWSYFNTGRHEQAATAYARAVALDPSSAELKLAYEEAKSKASDGGNLETVSSSQTEAAGAGDGLIVETAARSEATPPHESDAAIRSMVDGLADRLERSPRDVEGWTRLMRSRVVLGEREVAATALRKALEVFKDDAAASGEITSAAIELGLDVE